MDLEIISRTPNGMPAHATPLLFIHGAYAGAWVWDEHFLAYFAEHGYESHAVSLRGHGGSDGLDTLCWTSLADYVEDVAEAVRRIGRPPALIGHSMGGMVAQSYRQAHDDVPATVLMASLPPFGLFAPSMVMALSDPILFYQLFLMQSAGPDAVSVETMRRALFSDAVPYEKILGYFHRMKGGESQRVVFDLMGWGLPLLKIDPASPILVVGAADDAFVPAAHVVATGWIFGTQAQIFPDMAHAMMLEPGWQQVADHIIDWLDETLGLPEAPPGTMPASVPVAA